MDAESKIEKFEEEILKISPRAEQVAITPYRGRTTVFSSKFGGVPYYPKDMEYPTVRSGAHRGRPIRFLAQINFSELPHIENFPESGILQFFAGCDGDDLYGADFDDELNQNAFRIVFHENVTMDEGALITQDDMPVFEEGDYPFEGEFALKFGRAEQKCVSSNDFRFGSLACSAYNKAFSTFFKKKKTVTLFGDGKNRSIEDDDPNFCEVIFESGTFAGTGCKVGGYPFFTQGDVREKNPEYGKCDILLLQVDSVGDGPDAIMWGDSGVANFFISADDLAAKNFDRVIYNWDCC